jgi:hypothetical protein
LQIVGCGILNDEAVVEWRPNDDADMVLPGAVFKGSNLLVDLDRHAIVVGWVLVRVGEAVVVCIHKDGVQLLARIGWFWVEEVAAIRAASRQAGRQVGAECAQVHCGPVADVAPGQLHRHIAVVGDLDLPVDLATRQNHQRLRW